MYTDIYTASLPPELLAMAETPVMQRLLRVGMHCGCEYTAYPIYRDAVAPYSRYTHCLLYTSPSPRDRQKSRMPSSA